MSNRPRRTSELYCAKCRHRRTCAAPCYPVERLLATVTEEQHEVVTDTLDTMEDTPSNYAFIPSSSWEHKSLKRKIFELYFIDKLSQPQVACIAGCSHQYVSRVATELLSIIDKL